MDMKISLSACAAGSLQRKKRPDQVYRRFSQRSRDGGA